METTTTEPYALDNEEGKTVSAFGALITIKAEGSQTGGSFGMIDEVMPPGFETPYHIHHAEDEAFYVLEGEITFVCGGQKIKALPGTYVWGPRDVPHGVRVDGDQPARMLLMSVPSSFIEFTLEMAEPVQDRTKPPTGGLDIDKVMRIAPRYGLEVLGPMPE